MNDREYWFTLASGSWMETKRAYLWLQRCGSIHKPHWRPAVGGRGGLASAAHPHLSQVVPLCCLPRCTALPPLWYKVLVCKHVQNICTHVKNVYINSNCTNHSYIHTHWNFCTHTVSAKGKIEGLQAWPIPAEKTSMVKLYLWGQGNGRSRRQHQQPGHPTWAPGGERGCPGGHPCPTVHPRCDPKQTQPRKL